MRRHVRLGAWVKKEDGFTVGLMFSGFLVAFGCALVLIFTWVGSAMNGYVDLVHVAKHVSLAGESQAKEIVTVSPGGFAVIGWHMDLSLVQEASDQSWNTQRTLLSDYTLLTEVTTLEGNDVVVTVSGDYLPGPLARLVAVWPKLGNAIAIPMRATVKQAYFVPN